MSFDIRKIESSKKRLRGKLAQLPILEKLRILEQLRDEKLPKRPCPDRRGSKNSGQNV
jgi:hypothetical protein